MRFFLCALVCVFFVRKFCAYFFVRFLYAHLFCALLMRFWCVPTERPYQHYV